MLAVPGVQNKVGAFLTYLVPRLLARKLAQFLQS